MLLGLLAAAPAWASSPGAGPALAVAIDPVHPQTVWATSLAGLRKSTDGGATFRPVVVPDAFGGIERVVTAAGGVFAVDRFEFTWWSGDGGVTWRRSQADGSGPIERSPADPSLVVAVLAERPRVGRIARPRADRQIRLCIFDDPDAASTDSLELIASHDGGATWAPIPRTPFPAPPVGIAVAGGGLIVRTAAFSDIGESVHVFRSTDLGAHWTDITGPWPEPDDITIQRVVADATVPTRLWLASPSVEDLKFGLHVRRSDDLGSTWTDVGDVPGQRIVSTTAALVVPSPPDLCGRPFSTVTASGPGLRRSGDLGATFTPDAAGLPERTAVVAYAREGAVEAVATPIGVFHRSGGGAWIHAGRRLAPAVVRDLVDDGRHLYAGTADGGYVSDDDGRSWSPIAGLPAHADIAELAAAHGRVAVGIARPAAAVFEGPAGGVVVPVRGFPAERSVHGLAYEPAGTLLVATGDRLLRLSHGRLARVHRFGRIVMALAVDLRGRIRVAVELRSVALLTSEDGGRTWSGRRFPQLLALPRVVPVGNGYYLDGLAATAFSPDGRRVHPGTTGSFGPTGSHARLAPLPAHPRVAWTVGDFGLLRTHDGGGHWQSVPPDLFAGVSSVLLHGDELIFATYDKGIRRRPAVVGELSRPTLSARYHRRTATVSGRVRDRHLHGAQVSVDARCASSVISLGANVASNGRFRATLPFDEVGRGCKRWRLAVTALDRSGNASRTIRLTVVR